MLAQVNELVLGASGTFFEPKYEAYEGPGFKIEHAYWGRWTGAGGNGNRCYVPSGLYVTNTARIPINVSVFLDLDDNGLIWDAVLCDASQNPVESRWINFNGIAAGARVQQDFCWGVINRAGVPYTETFEVRFNMGPRVIVDYTSFGAVHLGTSRVSTV